MNRNTTITEFPLKFR